MPEEQYLRLREDVARTMDYEWRQDSQLVQLRAQIDAMEKQLRVATDEAHEYQHKIDGHRCGEGDGLSAGTYPLPPGSGILPSGGAGTYKPHAEGLFFINVDPVVVNCELDVRQVCLARDSFVTGHSNGYVSVWDAGPGNQQLRGLREHTGRITAMNVEGHELLTASSDSTVRRWDLSTGANTGILSGHRGSVNAMHRHGNRLVTGGADTILQVWDLERATTVSTLKGHHSAVTCLKFESDVLVSCEWGWALFWDLRTYRVVRSLRDEQGGINCLDYANGIAVAGGCGGDLTIWDVAQGTGDTVSAHTDDVLCVQLHGKSAVTSGGDHKIRMWDLSSMKALGVFHDSHPYETPSFEMQGKRFVAGQGPFVRLWQK